jgi:hypothetical protein
LQPDAADDDAAAAIDCDCRGFPETAPANNVAYTTAPFGSSLIANGTAPIELDPLKPEVTGKSFDVVLPVM